MTIVTVGSLRDTAVAFNRDPTLFYDKVDRLIMFIGNAANPPVQYEYREYNVALDPTAYVAILRSGLPIYWVPCFDGPLFTNRRGYASWWTATWEELLPKVSSPLLQYFVFAMLQPSADPLSFLDQPVDDRQKQQLFSVEPHRNLWCAAVFSFVAGRRIVRQDTEYVAEPAGTGTTLVQVRPFYFASVGVEVDDNGYTTIGSAANMHSVSQFRVSDLSSYPEVMTSVTRNLLGEDK